MSINNNNLIWIDLEMTGLDPKNHRIIEIATIITDSNLSILAEGPSLVIYQSKAQLDLMDNWNNRVHTNSGLIKLIKKSKINEKIAESKTISFLSKWVDLGKSPICGNTIGQDRRFLFSYMPKLESYFHYHYLDVSTIKELVSRWKPNILPKLKKKKNHRSLNDIYDSIKELSYYRKYFINI